MTSLPLSLLILSLVLDPFATLADRVDETVFAALRRGDCPGAVVVVVHKDQVILRRAYGFLAVTPSYEPMPVDAIFDLASLTKPVATATAVAILMERGKIARTDPVAKYWPAFAAQGKDRITLGDCLTHTAGLIADNSIKDYVGTREEMLARIAALKPDNPPGKKFVYSDVGFLVLGEVVERVTGQPLDRFTATEIFEPLRMADTRYRPSTNPRIAPTGLRNGAPIRGAVHDPRAFALEGRAGDAGLFGTADDLSRYVRCLMRGGELDGVRILKPESVAAFVKPRPVPGGSRSDGWDVDTSFSAPRGDRFPRGEGFGHTGFTGTSIWVDPASQTAVILLTSRLHPNEKGNVTALRKQIATLVAEAVGR